MIIHIYGSSLKKTHAKPNRYRSIISGHSWQKQKKMRKVLREEEDEQEDVDKFTREQDELSEDRRKAGRGRGKGKGRGRSVKGKGKGMEDEENAPKAEGKTRATEVEKEDEKEAKQKQVKPGPTQKRHMILSPSQSRRKRLRRMSTAKAEKDLKTTPEPAETSPTPRRLEGDFDNAADEEKIEKATTPKKAANKRKRKSPAKVPQEPTGKTKDEKSPTKKRVPKAKSPGKLKKLKELQGEGWVMLGHMRELLKKQHLFIL